MHLLVVCLGRLALGGFSFYYKRKNVRIDDYLKSSTPTFILEPNSSAVFGIKILSYLSHFDTIKKQEICKYMKFIDYIFKEERT